VQTEFITALESLLLSLLCCSDAIWICGPGWVHRNVSCQRGALINGKVKEVNSICWSMLATRW